MSEAAVESLLGATEAAAQDAASTTDATKAETETAVAATTAAEVKAEPAGAPEAYADFTVKEGYSLDATVMGEFVPLAKAMNLPQAEAQKLIDFAPKFADAVSAQTQAATLDQLGLTDRAKWIEQTKADPEVGGDKLAENLGIAAKFRTAFVPAPLMELLKKTGLDNNPEMVRMFVRAGKAISQDGFVSGGKQTTPTRFFDKSDMKL